MTIYFANMTIKELSHDLNHIISIFNTSSTALALTFLYLSQKCRKIRPEKFNKAKRKATIQTVF